MLKDCLKDDESDRPNMTALFPPKISKYSPSLLPALPPPNIQHSPPAKDEEKPTQSYVAIIAMAILESKYKKLVLSDIYKYILEKYPYFKDKGQGWRNSVRHNLSLNQCFAKAGRAENGKGNYWTIHPANIADFR